MTDEKTAKPIEELFYATAVAKLTKVSHMEVRSPPGILGNQVEFLLR